MVKMTISLSEELDTQFRKTVANRLGMKRGNLQVAVEEAFNDWIKKGNAG